MYLTQVKVWVRCDYTKNAQTYIAEALLDELTLALGQGESERDALVVLCRALAYQVGAERSDKDGK